MVFERTVTKSDGIFAVSLVIFKTIVPPDNVKDKFSINQSTKCTHVLMAL